MRTSSAIDNFNTDNDNFKIDINSLNPPGIILNVISINVANCYEFRSSSAEKFKLINKPCIKVSKHFKVSSQNRVKLTNSFSKWQIRSIPHSILVDFEIITKNDTSNVINKSKIFRETNRVREGTMRNADQILCIKGLYFDGR